MKHNYFHQSAKYLFCLLILFCLNIEMKSQNYSEKYNSILKRYEFFDSRGNMVGHKKWDPILKKWEYTDLQQQNNSSGREYSTPKSPYDWDFMLKAAQIKQAQIDKQRQENTQKEAYERQERINLKERILNNYRSASSYPSRVEYGWYNVIVTDDSQDDFCKERKFLVSNNIIQRYIIDDFWENPVVYSSEIKDGHCSIKLKNRRDDQYGYAQVYFMDCVMNPSNPYANPPATPGEVSFWTTDKKAVKSGGIDIYIDGYFMGTLNDYFSKKDLRGKKAPTSCDQLGTLKVRYKPGKYKYEAISNRGKWNGFIEIVSGRCHLYGLLK